MNSSVDEELFGSLVAKNMKLNNYYNTSLFKR